MVGNRQVFAERRRDVRRSFLSRNDLEMSAKGGKAKVYRQYENPWNVQELLRNAEERYEKAIADGADDERLFDLHEDVEELKSRLRIAWADQEYDETYELTYYPEKSGGAEND